MPETVDTAGEIVKIRREIMDIKQSQEADMHLNREKYQKLVDSVLKGRQSRIKIFLEIDGMKSRKEIQVAVSGDQGNTWRTMDVLESVGLIVKLEETKGGSPIYAKARWARALRMDDYVRQELLTPTVAQQSVIEQQGQTGLGNSNSQPSA